MNLQNAHSVRRPIAGVAGLVALVFLCMSVRASADYAIYTVGGDAACQFSQIQDAVNAAAAHPGEDYVWVASNKSYAGQHIVITDQDVDIEGGFSDCNDYDPKLDKTTIIGTSGHSVFEIEGNSHVYMQGLNVTGGDLDNDHRGGGIFFGGRGDLTLSGTSVYSNNAGYGAGLAMSPSGPATLTLLAGTLVFNNTAGVSGGGIRLEGSTIFRALQSPTWIAENHAPNGYGGGIEVLGPATADIGSAGFNGAGVVSGNDAANGGGLDILDVGQGYPLVRFFAQSPTQPSAISNNLATSKGGGIYMQGAAYACAFATHIDGNIAEEGAAVYATAIDYDDDGVALAYRPAFYVNASAPSSLGGAQCGLQSPEQLGGATLCADGVATCSTFTHNKTEHADASPSAGSVIYLNEGAMSLNRMRASHNTAALLINEESSKVGITFSVLDGNSLDTALVNVIESSLLLGRSTVADNTISENFLVRDDGSSNSTFENDILTQSQGVYFFYGDNSFPSTIACAFLGAYNLDGCDVHDFGSVVVIGDPGFVDSANGNYHLLPTSSLLDFAPPLTADFASFSDGLNIDLDNKYASVDLPVANKSGASDLGAYEVQLDTVLGCAVSDTIFCNGFEM